MVTLRKRLTAKKPWWERALRARAARRIRKLRRESQEHYAAWERVGRLHSKSLETNHRLESDIDSLTADHERALTRIRVLESENEILTKQVQTMAAVIQRDQERVITETDILVKLRDGVSRMVPPGAVLANELAGE